MKVSGWLRERLAVTEGEVEALVVLRPRADLSAAARLPTKEEKGAYVRDALWSVAAESQAPLLAELISRGIPHRPFYVVNQVWVRARGEDLYRLAARADVLRVDGNPVVASALPAQDLARRELARPEPLTPVSGIAQTRAPEAWAAGVTGHGIVVGGQDTGYQWDHPALKARYRGWNGATANHDFAWYDAVSSPREGNPCGSSSPSPCDDNNHGTHTMGTAVGDDGLGNQVGMAPGATWIGCRDMDRGSGTPATYAACLEFFLAPWPQGKGPAEGDPRKAPDVTINSWACPASEGCTVETLEAALDAQRAAGILSVAAVGNSGPRCGTVTDPPAYYASVLSVGALQTGTDAVATFSSRGPVSADGSGRAKPELMAPGTGIRSSVRGGGYEQSGFNGTSMACPHVAGAAALVLSAQPALRGHPDAARQVLLATASPIPHADCSSSGVPNNVFGWGRLDAKAAVDAARTWPILLDVEPASGPAAGGTEVVLRGANLKEGVAIAFGGAAARVSRVEGDGSALVVVSPAGTGDVDVVATNPDGTTWRLPGGFAYRACPTLPFVATSNGPVCAGYPLVLYASTVPGAAYRWTGPNGFASTSQNPWRPAARLEDAGDYTVVATVPLCPSRSASTRVVVAPVPADPPGSAAYQAGHIVAGCLPGPEDR